MDKELNVMKIKLSLDVSEATEKLNRCEDQMDRILEKQKLIGVDKAIGKDRTGISILVEDGQRIDVDDRNVEHLANELNFYMKQQKTGDYDIKKLAEELEFYRRQSVSMLGR